MTPSSLFRPWSRLRSARLVFNHFQGVDRHQSCSRACAAAPPRFGCNHWRVTAIEIWTMRERVGEREREREKVNTFSDTLTTTNQSPIHAIPLPPQHTHTPTLSQSLSLSDYHRSITQTPNVPQLSLSLLSLFLFTSFSNQCSIFCSLRLAET